MKICQISTGHLAFDTRIFLKECKSLKQKGYDVVLIANHPADEIKEGIKIKALPNITKRLFRMFLLPFFALYYALIEKAQIYHFHDPELIFVGLFLQMLKKKVIFDIHESVYLSILEKPYIHSIFRRPIAKLYRLLECIAVRIFTYNFVATPFIATHYHFVRHKVTVLNNYPILDEFTDLKHDWSAKKDSICFVGGISIERGLEEMILATQESDVAFLLAGGMAQELYLKFNKFLDYPHLKYYGQVNRDQMKNIFCQSIAGFVLYKPCANVFHARPNKLFEVMSAGLPLIVSHFEDWTNIVEKEECGIAVDPENIVEISNAINYLKDNKKLAQKMGHKARELVLKKYSWNFEAKKLFDVYDNILLNKQSG